MVQRWLNKWILCTPTPPPPPKGFVEADDIITNLTKEREPGIEIIKSTSQYIFDYYSFTKKKQFSKTFNDKKLR